MAKLRDEPSSLPRIRGKFGDKIYKWYGDTCVIQALPRRRKRRTTGQEKKTHDNMRQAVRYAQGVIADADAKAYYADVARQLRRSVYIVAKADALKAPTLEFSRLAHSYEGRAGKQVMIGTGDLFRVQTLRVTVRDAAGDVVETGDATRKQKNFFYHWKRDHPCGQPLTVEAFATSRAGHRVILTARVATACAGPAT
jgi:hypothetical protein